MKKVWWFKYMGHAVPEDFLKFLDKLNAAGILPPNIMTACGSTIFYYSNKEIE